MDDDNEFPAVNIGDAKAEIATGAKALRDLYNHVADDWNRWSAAIRGLRMLRELAFNSIGTRNMKAQGYRDAMGVLLAQPKNAAYAEIDKETRSYMYKLCDQIDEVDVWYGTLPIAERLQWKHPQSIFKHCPDELKGSDHPRERGPKKKGKPKKKKGSTFEEDRLRKLLVYVIEKYVRAVDPKEAAQLIEQVWAGELDDEIDDIYTPERLEH